MWVERKPFYCPIDMSNVANLEHTTSLKVWYTEYRWRILFSSRWMNYISKASFLLLSPVDLWKQP